jgi:acyl-coenzyme A thioesterase PaaI-like protein
MWLPRFIDKARHHLAGTLEAGYQRAFCSPAGADGVFLSHFKLGKGEILEAIQREGSDEAIARWFLRRPDSSEGRIAAWNELAPNIGKPGYPLNRTFALGLKSLYAGCSDPRVDSGFTAIAWDEGFLDEILPREPVRHAESGPTARPRPSPAAPAADGVTITELPFNRLIGMEVSRREGSIFSLPGDTRYTNHLGHVHASALLALAEAASGELLKRALENGEYDVLPVVRRVEAKFRNPAVGAVYAAPAVSEADMQEFLAALAAKARSFLEIRVDVHDEAGTHALIAKVEWFVSRKR